MSFDVLVSGLNVIDFLLTLPSNIEAGKKHQVDKLLIQGGAPAGNGACGMSALGLNTAFLGFIGDNAQSAIAEKEFQRFGVNTSLLIPDKNTLPATALVEVEPTSGERTVFYSTVGYRPLAPADINEQWLENTKLLYVDGYDVEGNTALLQLAKHKGIPSVLDIEAGDHQQLMTMLSLGSHVILPLEAAQCLSKKQSPHDCLTTLAQHTNAQLLVTDGANGSWALLEEEILFQPCFEVAVVDTTGCGDAYHASYAYALLQKYPLAKRMEFAAAFAAIVATHFGGRSYFPSEDEVNNFIKNYH